MSANQSSPTSVLVVWDDNSSNEDNYLLYRSVGGGSFSLYQTLSENTIEYDDTGLSSGTEYSYEVSAKNEAGESAKAGPVSETPLPDTPDAPSNFSISTGTNSDELDAIWVDNSDNEDNFEVVEDVGGEFFTRATVSAGVESTTVTGLSPGTQYDMRVRAVNVAGSTLSNEDTATTKLETPSVSKETIGEGTEFERITLSWGAITGADDYELFRDGTPHDTTTNTTYDVTCNTADGTWKVKARSSTVPNSNLSTGVSHTC